MSRHFDPHLVNDPFGDPALYVQLVFEHRALLFDMGDLSQLSPRQLLRISNVFISHRHMDHFAGFDQFLKVRTGTRNDREVLRSAWPDLDVPEVGAFDAMIVAASVHEQEHQDSAINFTAAHLDQLIRKPSCGIYQ